MARPTRARRAAFAASRRFDPRIDGSGGSFLAAVYSQVRPARSPASVSRPGRVRRRRGPRRRPSSLTSSCFDGKSPGLRGGKSLRIEDGRIKQVAGTGQGAPEGARLIDCGGHVLMPGLIDAHWHVMFASLNPAQLLTADIGFVYLSASAQAVRTLMRGFTTVRDLGGPSFPLKKAIDSGLAVGPRIYPSGAVVTTTGGHGDMRMNSDVPRSPGGPQSQLESVGAAAIADSPDEVRLRVREQLFLGASQIKMIGGGGIASPRTTLDMVTFTVPELRAGVEAAADRNTYVAVHAYPPAAIQRAIDAGASASSTVI